MIARIVVAFSYLFLASLFLAILFLTPSQKMAVKIENAEVSREALPTESGLLYFLNPSSSVPEIRDVRYILARDAEGNSVRFRNEDTGSYIPGMFASDNASVRQSLALELNGTWVVIEVYEWSKYTNVFKPNIISITPARGGYFELVNKTSILLWALIAFMLFGAIFVWFGKRRPN